jgi:hypothetical protein
MSGEDTNQSGQAAIVDNVCLIYNVCLICQLQIEFICLLTWHDK